MTRAIAPLLCTLGLLGALESTAGNPAARAEIGQEAAGAADRLERAYRANNAGVAHLEQFDYSGAERRFREALEIRPELAIAQLNLAIALLYAGQSDLALVEARSAAGLLPDSPHAQFVLGLAGRAEDELAVAEPAFRRVLELDPADAGARIHLGQVYLQQRRFDVALPLFREALEAEPHNVTAAYNVALALTRAGQEEESRRAMQAFEALRDSAYGVTYSQTYLGQGRYGEAVASTGAEPDLVDEAPPKATFVDATESFFPSQSGGTAETPGGLTLFDADGDGALDLLVTGPGAPRFYRNEGGRFVDRSERLGRLPAGTTTGAIAGDYDNDGRPDLLLLRDAGYLLLRQASDGSFEDVTGKALPDANLRAATAAFSDVDHDGDLDIIAAGAAVQLLRNNGDGTFTDITAAAGLGGFAAPVAAVASVDFDNRRDVDILLAPADGAPALFRNMRDGSFRDAPAGLPPAGRYRALALGDINKDRFTDLFFAGGGEAGTFALSDGRGQFRVQAAPEGTGQAIAAQFLDYDNDGLLDLLTLSPTGARLHRNLGSRWDDVTRHAGLDALIPGSATFQSLAAGDLTGNGARDLVIRLSNGDLRVWRNDAAAPNRALPVRLSARVSNRSGYGARVEIRAGSLHQMLDWISSTPAVTPADLVFGAGTRPAVDEVRVLWPSGILQAETDIPALAVPPVPVEVAELDRKPSSCPYLFTWNGTRFEFVTDFMGGGEMGAWLAPSVWNDPDPDEFVRIRADQLQPRDGRYEVRITNELEEALFVDRVQLLAVDHPAGTEVYPNEGLRSSPRPPFRLAVTREARPPVRAVDGHGRDVLPQLLAVDRRYPDGFGLLPVRGYAEPHELILDLGPVSDRAVLLMTGWTDYAFSNDNVAASQGGTSMSPPLLQVKDAQGRWRTVIDEIGFPVGRPQTVLVDLAGRFLSASREVRILTNMRIYWDRILVAEPDGARAAMTGLDPISADLRWRGFSEETTPDGREPYGYDYQRVSSASPWKALVGRYTREGDVRALLRRVDDLFVISRPGDEIALSFRALPPVRPGRARTFLLYSFGYSKEMNPRSASPDTVLPLPFRAMSGYPYGPGEHYPRTRRHREYMERYNTRVVPRSVPSIDSVMLRAPDGGAGRTGAAE